ncbi:MAG: DUF418 domain-containing protein [Chloroflexaceae bacterium]
MITHEVAQRGQTMAETVAPTQPRERIAIVDILRGFAIFGILLVNMMIFAAPVYQFVLETSPWPGPVNQAAASFIRFTAEGKFFTMFSLLFGLGLTMQMSRAESRSIRFVPLYLRRMFILLLFGLAHVLLFWPGDILTYYAILGTLLLFFRKRSPRTLLIWAVILLIIPMVLNTGLFGLVALAGSTPEGAAIVDEQMALTIAEYKTSYQEALRIYTEGSFAEMAMQRLQDFAFSTMGIFLNGMFFVILAMFLLGLYVGRRRLLHDIPANLPFFRRVMRWSLVVGLVTNLLYVWLSTLVNPAEFSLPLLLSVVSFVIGAPALCLFYVTALIQLTQNQSWQQRLMPLAAVGRTALSNYLLQTLVCTTIFYGYGLGLMGQVGPALGLLLSITIFSVQVIISNWWVRRFRFGPMEWLWRTATYGKLQPMRVQSLQERHATG